LKKVINNILVGDIKNLDIKKLKGHGNIFRVRIGDIRVVFKKDSESTKLIFVGRRNDVTYKNFK